MKNLLDDQSANRRDRWDTGILCVCALLGAVVFVITILYLDHLDLFLEGITMSMVLNGIAIVYVRTLRIRRENKQIYDLLVTLKDRIEKASPISA